jgi:2-oxoisovalerate dehydrogenase E1 component alpha subunit
MKQLRECYIRYKNMALLPVMDTLLYNIQRQGKISFYVSVFSKCAPFNCLSDPN